MAITITAATRMTTTPRTIPSVQSPELAITISCPPSPRDDPLQPTLVAGTTGVNPGGSGGDPMRLPGARRPTGSEGRADDHGHLGRRTDRRAASGPGPRPGAHLLPRQARPRGRRGAPGRPALRTRHDRVR